MIVEHVQRMQWAESVSGDIEGLLDVQKHVFLDSTQKQTVERITKRLENSSALMCDCEGF